MKITTVKEKAKAIWRKHKGKILFVMTAVGIVVVCRKIDQKHQDAEIVDKALRDFNDAWSKGETNEEAMKKELLESEQAAKEEMSEFDRKMNDPANQIPGGGWVLEDYMHDADLPQMVANDVPVTSLGEFGEEMLRRAGGTHPGHPDCDPSKIKVSLMANFQTPEEEETENDQLQDSAQ